MLFACEIITNNVRRFFDEKFAAQHHRFRTQVEGFSFASKSCFYECNMSSLATAVM